MCMKSLMILGLVKGDGDNDDNFLEKQPFIHNGGCPFRLIFFVAEEWVTVINIFGPYQPNEYFFVAYHWPDKFGQKSKKLDWKPGSLFLSLLRDRYFSFTSCRPLANGGEYICTKIQGCRLYMPKILCLAQHGKMHFRYCTQSHLPLTRVIFCTVISVPTVTAPPP